MKALIFLDLSNNQISKLELTQLPTQLQFLNLLEIPALMMITIEKM